MNPSSKTPTSIGHHWLIEIYGIQTSHLEKKADVQKALNGAVKAAKATKVSENFHQFDPFGVSGVIVIEESHFTIHTWPEYGYAAIDFFTCGVSIDCQKAVDYLKEVFQAKEVEVQYFKRGNLAKAKSYFIEK
jgi:S-adenosylmethionine decarboxylase proenzyme